MRQPRGIIFDFDGVLVDTEWEIYRSWVWLYEREGQQISIETYAPCLGAGYSHWDPAAHLETLTGRRYDWESLTPIRQARINDALLRAGLMDGAQELMDWCAEQGIGMTVASSSSRHWVEGWLRRLGIEERFAGVFCRTDGYPVKPDPALFLAARECLDVPAQDCLIIEDSPNGVLAASRAGIPCVAVPNRMTAAGDFSLAPHRAESLTDLLQALK